MAQRHFLVTIGADTELDVHDVQGAIVYEAERAHDDDVDHGDVDVQLIEADKVDHMSNYKITTIRYSVLDAC